MKFAWLMSYMLIACGDPGDPRDTTPGEEDESLAYITETIFVPYCATAECHSSFKQAGYPGGQPIVLDTPAHAQTTLHDGRWLQCTGHDNMPHDPCDLNADPEGLDAGTTGLAELIGSGGSNGLQMPYDQALPSKDVTFIVQWIADGAIGYTPNADVLH